MAVTGYDNYSYRWRTGFVNAAQLTATYAISNFTRFADMAGRKWFDPEATSWFNEGSQFELALNGDASFLGLQTVQWVFVGLTSQMLDYVLYNASLFNGAASMDSTIGTWNGTRNRWEVVWTKSRRGLISEIAEPGYGRGALRLTIDHLVTQDAP